MNYVELSLNGTWEMAYAEEKYSGYDNPWQIYVVKSEEDSASVENADPDTVRYNRIVYTYSVFQEAAGKSGIRNSEIPNDRVSAGYGTSEYYG